MPQITVDAAEYRRVADQLAALPPKMQRQALGRAIGRSKTKVERTYAQLAAKRMRIAQKHVRNAMSTSMGDGDLTVKVKSNQIPVYKLGARQTGVGLTVPLRGSYKHAFKATMKSGHESGFIRNEAGGGRVRRGPVHEVRGPSPAGELQRNPDAYRAMLSEIFDEELLRQVASNVASLLRKIGK